jgi:predicted dehydrogenase
VKQAVQNLRTGEVRVAEVPPPRLRRGGALVATTVSLISAGTERQKIEMGEKSLLAKARARPELARQVVQKAREDGLRETYQTVMQRLEAPNPLGYSLCGRVVAVAPDCEGLAPGDLVACAGAGYANHAEVNFVPKHLLARVPDGVSPDQAAFATLGAIAMQGVRQAGVGLGDRVAVIGLGLVGQLTVQLLRAAGVRTMGVDLDPEVCALAERLGAERTIRRHGAVEAVAEAFTGGLGMDAALVCASAASDDPVRLAAELCRDRGRVVIVGIVNMALPRDPFYDKELELRMSRSYGPGRYDPAYEERGQDYPPGYVRWTEQGHLEEFLRLVGTGAVDVAPLTTHRYPVDRAAEAYALISGKLPEAGRPIGVLLDYPDAAAAADRYRVEVPPAEARTPVAGRPRVAMIGAGNFATRVILPALVGTERVALAGIATASGATARQVAERFGFTYATSDTEALLADPEVDAVIVATRHDSHAGLAARALRAGKATFCEKPLATTWEGLEDVAAAYAEHPAPLLVGFNRRFSPLTEELRRALPPGVPRAIVCRVNAGPMPRDHWMRDPVAGGGRIVGELCHFLDLACHLAEGRPVRVSAEALAGPDPIEMSDSLVVQVSFACGSVASLQYLANGNPRVAKERVEVFAGGTVGLIDDFRRLELSSAGRRTTRSLRRQEKGHREEMRTFAELAGGRRTRTLTPEAAFWSSALTLQVPAALARAGVVRVSLPRALGGDGAGAEENRPEG